MSLSAKPKKYKKYTVVDGRKHLERYEKFSDQVDKISQKIDKTLPSLEKELALANLSQSIEISKACTAIDYSEVDPKDLTKMLGERVNIHKTLSGKGDTTAIGIRIDLNNIDDSSKNVAANFLDKAESSQVIDNAEDA